VLGLGDGLLGWLKRANNDIVADSSDPGKGDVEFM
jgi:hypothetical protein